jgi:hypothetical protein
MKTPKVRNQTAGNRDKWCKCKHILFDSSLCKKSFFGDENRRYCDEHNTDEYKCVRRNNSRHKSKTREPDLNIKLDVGNQFFEVQTVSLKCVAVENGKVCDADFLTAIYPRQKVYRGLCDYHLKYRWRLQK